MPRVALIAALEQEVSGLVKTWKRVQQQHEGRNYTFFEHDDLVCVCGGIGAQAARRATEAVIALYHPALVHSIGFAGAIDTTLCVGEIFTPAIILDARDGSRVETTGGKGILVTFMDVASVSQKANLCSAYGAQAVDMEAAAVATVANKYGIAFTATKAISDEADFEIPGTERFITHDGHFRAASFAAHAALRPWLWPRVAQLARNSRKAANVLAKHLTQITSNHGNSEIATIPTSGRRP